MLQSDVQSGRRFSSPGDDGDLAIGDIFKPLEILSIDEDTYDHSVNFEFTFQDKTLFAHLVAADRLALVDFDLLITTFLQEASTFGTSFVSSVDGRQAIDSLPISQSVFTAPPHFQSAIDALCQSAFCAEVDGGYLWTSSVRPFMESARLWVGDKTRDEVRETELTEIWDTMPPKLRSLIRGKQKGSLNVLGLAMVIGNFRYGGRWHEKPKNKDNFQGRDLSLSGGHIPTAKEIGRLYSDGKLRD